MTRFSARLVLVVACLLLAPSFTLAFVYRYVDWTTADAAAGTASGVITLPDSSTVTATFDVRNPDGSPGKFFFAITNGGGANYWVPSSPYISTQVENAPPDTDILGLVGGTNSIYRVTLSEPIKDPIMAIVSLGQPGFAVDYDFDRPFSIVSQGTGFWGGNATSLQKLPGDILRGNEGHGTIQFNGTFSVFQWTAPIGETWHGFTYGIRTTEAIEPTVPEPGTLGLAAIALLGLGVSRSTLMGGRS
jgi:hypothetical protein